MYHEFVVSTQGYHRDVLEHWAPPPQPKRPGAPVVFNSQSSIVIDKQPKISTEFNVSNPKKTPSKKHRRDKKSSSRGHRKVAAGSRNTINRS